MKYYANTEIVSVYGRKHAVLDDLDAFYKVYGWTLGSLATDAAGNRKEVFSDEATCFCLMGALIRMYGNAAYGFRNQRMWGLNHDALREMTVKEFPSVTRMGGMEVFNDSLRDKDDLLNVLQRLRQGLSERGS